MPTLYVDGVETGWSVGSLSIDTAVDERSSASFVLADTAETSTVQKGTPVVIVDEDENGDAYYVFAGVVDSTSRRAIVTPDGGGIFVTVQCADNHWYVDKRIVAASWDATSIGTIARQLVKDFGRDENIYDHPYPGHAVAHARTDLLGYWRLADGPTDDSYRGLDGTDVGDPVYSGLGTGSPVGDDNLGGYVTLDSNDYLSLPTSASVIGGSWTVAGWVRKTASTTPSLWSEGVPAAWASDLLIIYTRETTADIRVWVDGGARLTVATGTLTDGWHHIAVTYDEVTDLLTAYIDGVQVGQSTYAIVPWVSTSVRIGAGNNNGTAQQFLTGDAAEVQALSRAFTADEVADLYGQAGQTSRIATGDTLTKFVLNYQPLDEGFETLAELGGFDFFIDPYRTLHLHGRGAACCTSPFTVTDANILSGSADLSTEAPKYRNVQVVKGGKDETTQQVELIEGDGDTRAFLTGFAISRVPTIEVETGVGTGVYTTQTVGIRGVSEGVQFYWSKNDFAVTQDEGETVVGDGVRVRITYLGSFPIVVISTDEAERIGVRAIEKAGTGKVETVIEDASIDSRAAGFDVASSKLERFAQRGQTITFTTRDPGLRAGQLVTIDFSRYGVASTEALIDTVTVEDFDGFELRYKCSAVTGPTLTSWRQFFAKPAKRLTVPTERTNIGQEEIINLPVNFAESRTVVEVPGIVGLTCEILDGTSTFPFALC